MMGAKQEEKKKKISKRCMLPQTEQIAAKNRQRRLLFGGDREREREQKRIRWLEL